MFSTFPSDSLRNISRIFGLFYGITNAVLSVETATERSQLGFLPVLIFRSRLRHIIQG